MSTTDHVTEPETVRASRIAAELADTASALLLDGFAVYYIPEPRPLAMTSWLIFGKPDETGRVNTGTVSHDRFGGLSVSASLIPSREQGSSMMILDAEQGEGVRRYSNILEACRAAAQPTVQNSFQPALRNGGIEHFNWAADRMVALKLATR